MACGGFAMCGPYLFFAICGHIYFLRPSKSRVSDPHLFNADPDPRFDDLKLKKMYSWKFNFYYLDQKLQFTYP